jgi:tRNA/rRNA methyltransferase
MNLGQAVAVCLYELVRGGAGAAAETETGPSATLRDDNKETTATGAEVERVAMLLMEVLEKAGYARHHPANCGEADIRRLVVRMGLSVADVMVWMGMLRQMLWRMSQR